MNAASEEPSMATTEAAVSGPANPSPMAGLSLASRLGSRLSGRPGPVLASLLPEASVIPLEMDPGAAATTRRPCLLYSAASAWVMAWIPPLLAAYADMYGCAKLAEVELKFTITGS